jgi:hypothetical protein
MDYVQLRAAIQEYSQDFEASFVSNIDTFIRLTESRILLRVRLPPFRKQATGSLLLGENLIATPSDFMAPDHLAVTEAVVNPPAVKARSAILLNKDPEFLRECYPEDESGLPRFYTMLNERSLIVAPRADADFVLDMGYFYQAPSLVDSGQSWLGDHFAASLLSGSLAEAAKYMKEEDNLYARYDQQFEKDLAMDEQYAKGRTKKDTYQEPDTRMRV